MEVERGPSADRYHAGDVLLGSVRRIGLTVRTHGLRNHNVVLPLSLLHAVADVCDAAGRAWQPVLAGADGPTVPIFDAFVWVACTESSGLATLLEAVARTLDYPGLLARSVEDQRQAVRDLLTKGGWLKDAALG